MQKYQFDYSNLDSIEILKSLNLPYLNLLNVNSHKIYLGSFSVRIFQRSYKVPFINILDCPRELFCSEGWTGCDNPICQDVTTSSQPDTTTLPTANVVLILSTQDSRNVPIIVDFDGQ